MFGVAVAVVRVLWLRLAERRKLLDVGLHKFLFQFIADECRNE